MAQYTTSIKETAHLLGSHQSLVGILSESETAAPASHRTGVLLMNAGLIHHIGPNRLYVKLARLLAEIGYIVMRFDFSGIGDSGARQDKLPVNESVIQEAGQIMDEIEKTKGVKQFVLIGLCAGAANAFRMATIDRRVTRVILINPLLPNTKQVETLRKASHYRYKAILNPNSWIKFFLMKVNYRSLIQVMGYGIKKRILPNSMREKEPEEITRSISHGFNSLRKQNVKVLLINSAVDVGWKYFKEILGEEYKSMIKSGLLTTEMLSGSDHTVTPIRCQSTLTELISNWMAQNCTVGRGAQEDFDGDA